jgi:hypothetical protein
VSLPACLSSSLGHLEMVVDTPWSLLSPLPPCPLAPSSSAHSLWCVHLLSPSLPHHSLCIFFLAPHLTPHVAQMLRKDPSKRMPLGTVQSHPWIIAHVKRTGQILTMSKTMGAPAGAGAGTAATHDAPVDVL